MLAEYDMKLTQNIWDSIAEEMGSGDFDDKYKMMCYKSSYRIISQWGTHTCV